MEILQMDLDLDIILTFLGILTTALFTFIGGLYAASVKAKTEDKKYILEIDKTQEGIEQEGWERTRKEIARLESKIDKANKRIDYLEHSLELEKESNIELRLDNKKFIGYLQELKTVVVILYDQLITNNIQPSIQLPAWLKAEDLDNGKDKKV